MAKLKMRSPDLSQNNIANIRELFPGCVTEVQDEATGELRLAVDFDRLRRELGDDLVEGARERYRLEWPGRREALALANAPTDRSLRPLGNESLDFDETGNLFIEGDNLEALKLLQETYLGRVKLIYIDPPYNTGKDFVYRDNFVSDRNAHEVAAGERSEEGIQLVANPESNGRFHSDWLSMIYPRLKLARNLLSDDGVIFISIDDHEVQNLRKLCDEVFGPECFITTLVWRKRTGSNDSVNMASIDHDYIIVYARSADAALRGVEKDISNYTNPDNDPRGPWARDNLTCNKTAAERPNLFYPIEDPETGISHDCNPNRVWAYEKSRMAKVISEGKVLFPSKKGGTPMYKRHLSELKSNMKPFGSFLETKLNAHATKELRDLLGAQVFDYPKSVDLVEKLVSQGVASDGDTVLDFFAGSGTTAHAVMQFSAKTGKNINFIAVQVAEPVPEKSEAQKLGFTSIAEIWKERIKRAGKMLMEGECHEDWNRDVGFRALKVDTSNMKDVYYRPGELDQSDLPGMVDNVKEDRTGEDLLFQVLLDWGVDLTLPIQSNTVQGCCVFFVGDAAVNDNILVACFDRDVNEVLVKDLAGLAPQRAVFRDNGFASDAMKINVEQIFRQLSPGTEVRVL